MQTCVACAHPPAPTVPPLLDPEGLPDAGGAGVCGHRGEVDARGALTQVAPDALGTMLRRRISSGESPSSRATMSSIR
ncbi:hypothetical protein [Pseudonocardia sp. NPDC049154]|uniref:hypothetical protein n=1 Tax=Pseudonocardia sp. NPDC049154 TaxID=3155501 RepID=UPI00340DC9AD